VKLLLLSLNLLNDQTIYLSIYQLIVDTLNT